ncbi:hypothetical protein N9Q05_02090 [bacterium]|nr:hypothetical protein [bacterium]
MADITDTDIIELKQIVSHHLQGHSAQRITVRLQELTAKLNKSCKDLYTSISITNKKQTKNDNYITAIFASLDIDESSKEYKELIQGSDNLYKLLLNLYHNGYHHLEDLLRQIDAARPPHFWALYFILGAIFSAGLGVLFYFKQNYLNTIIAWCKDNVPIATRWLGQTFSLLRNIPVLGIIYYGIALIWRWYYTFANGTTTPAHKLSRLLFDTLNKGLIISAYVLSYIAAGVMTAPAATLFVIGSAIDVFESLYDLALLYKPNPKDKVVINEAKYPWRARAAEIRRDNQNKRLFNTVWTKLGAAFLITTSVIICCVFPPNLIISLSCIVFAWLVTMAKDSIITTINTRSNSSLQNKLFDPVENPYSKDDALTPAQTYSEENVSNSQMRMLDARVTELEKLAVVKTEPVVSERQASHSPSHSHRLFKDASTQTDDRNDLALSNVR